MRPLLLAVALLASTPAAAASRATVVLLPTTGSNVAPAQLAAAGDVLRAHLESTGRFAVVRAGPSTAAEEPTPADAAAAARAAGAALGVTVHVARLADTAVVRLAAYAPDGALVHTDELGALGADDLDPALQRLADALAVGGRATDVATIETVTAKEEVPLAKRTAWTAVALRIGGLVPMRRPDPAAALGAVSGIGLVLHYDARDWLADVSLEGYTSNLDAWRHDPDRAFALGLGVYKPLSKENVAPYVGIGLAYTVGRFNDVKGQGIQPRAGVGLLLGRLSNVAARFDVGWFLNAFPVRRSPTEPEVYVHGAIASITVAASEPTRR